MFERFSNLHNSPENLVRTVSKYLLAITLFTISFPRSWSLYPLGLLLISGLFLWIMEYRSVIKALRKEWMLVLPPVLFFLLHAASVIIGKGAIKLLEDRLMFILVPVFLFPLFHKEMPDQWNRVFIKSFIYGLTAISLFLFLHTFTVFLELKDGHSFSELMKREGYLFHYDYLSIFEHSSYLSLKLLWAIVLVITLRRQTGNSLVKNVILVIILTTTLYFLGSRAGLLAWAVTMILLLIRIIIKKRYNVLVWFTLPAFIALFLFLIVRVEKVENFIRSSGEKFAEERIDWKNIDVRTRVWYSTIQIIKEKPITGVGLPDVKRRLKEEYIRQNFTLEADLNLNAHNQFLETQVTFGVVGTLMLLWMLLTPIIERKRLKFQLQAIFLVLILIINLLFESMLNRQWGIMMFVLFYCIIVYQPTARDSISADTA